MSDDEVCRMKSAFYFTADVYSSYSFFVFDSSSYVYCLSSSWLDISPTSHCILI